MAEILERVACLSVRLVLQTALKAEVSVFLGRDRYQRDPDARPGYRNGHQPVTVKTTSGPVTLERPKLRGTDTAFASRLLGKRVTKTHALEALVIAGYVRGLSTRDVEASLAEALGAEAALSRSTVSRICEAIKAEFDSWRSRSLAEVELEYLYLDASHFKMHPGARAEPVLCAWGITTDGKPVLLAVDGANAESTDACVGFLRDLVVRGLRMPLLVITDGAPGLLGAVEQVFPHGLRQRCLVHRARNVLAKVSQADQDAVKVDYWQVFDDLHADPGEPAVAEARRRAEAFAARWGARYPGAVTCVLDSLPELTCHLRFPREHWTRIRHSNLIERTFGETRRRTKVIGRLPSERSCLSLVWAVLDRASGGWRGVNQTQPTSDCCSSCAARSWTHPRSSSREVVCRLSLSSTPHKIGQAEPTPDHFSTTAGTPPAQPLAECVRLLGGLCGSRLKPQPPLSLRCEISHLRSAPTAPRAGLCI